MEYQGDMLRRLHYFRNKFEILRSEKVCMVLRLFLSLFLFPLIFIFGYQRFLKYAILGDDIVIEDRHVAELYQEAMEATNGSSTGLRGAKRAGPPFAKFLSPWDSRSSVLRTSINLSLGFYSLSDFLLSDHTRNYVSTYRIFAPPR